MIGYVTLGTNDFDRAAAFYDEVLGVLGAKRIMDDEGFIAWGTAMDKPALSILRPYDGKDATSGNGTMVALVMDSTAMVDKVHAAALAAGGTDEGAPGERPPGGFYAGYFRDLDGNKLNAFVFQPPGT